MTWLLIVAGVTATVVGGLAIACVAAVVLGTCKDKERPWPGK